MSSTLLRWKWFWAYRLAPKLYLLMARREYGKINPTFIRQALDTLGEDRWPLILWTQGNRYLQQGGLQTYPQTEASVDVFLRDAAGRDRCPGPIRDQVEQWRSSGQDAAENLASKGSNSRLADLVSPIRSREPRLAALVEPGDLEQEALLRVQEVLKTPWIDWSVGKGWPGEEIQPTTSFARQVLTRLSTRKYGSNRKGERGKVYFDDNLDPRDSDHSRDFEQADARIEVDRLMGELSAKQREAVQVQLQANEFGISLEEMSRRLGRNPHRDRENFKAVQRRFPR